MYNGPETAAAPGLAQEGGKGRKPCSHCARETQRIQILTPNPLHRTLKSICKLSKRKWSKQDMTYEMRRQERLKRIQRELNKLIEGDETAQKQPAPFF